MTSGKSSGDRITALIAKVAAVPSHVPPVHPGLIHLVQRLPQVLVQHRLTGGGFPAFALPATNPFSNAVDNVFAVAMEGDGLLVGKGVQ